MQNENKRLAAERRDLAADMAICEAATAGPWYAQDIGYIGNNGWTEETVIAGISSDIYEKSDATFIAEARTGWPHAIERAMAAEAKLSELRFAIGIVQDQIITADDEYSELLFENDRLRRENAALRRLLPVTNEQAAEQLRFEREGRR